MKKTNLTLLLVGLLAVLSVTASCNTDDEQGITASGDCIITSATLGVLKRVMHTKDKAGNDSVYEANVTGSYYPLHIDQLGCRIFNTDSLPVGTDLRRTVFTALNSQGNVGIRSLVTNTDTIFSKTDSTDCSVDRLLTVYATDGVSRRTYTLSLCAHREEADSFVWKQMCTNDAQLARLAPGHRTFVTDGRIRVFGNMDGNAVVVSAPVENPTQWTTTALTDGPDAGTVHRFEDRFIALAGGRIVTSDDGETWTGNGSSFSPDGIAGAATNRIYSVKDGKFYASADGVTWTAEEADDAEQVPASGAVGITLASATDNTFENILVVGRNAAGAPVVWCKDIDLSGGIAFAWNYLPPVADEAFHCPALTAPSLIAYDRAALLTGNTADGKAAALYQSRDNGRTWSTADFSNPLKGSTAGISMAVDAEQFIWIIGGGQVWRGRLNRLGWENNSGAFE